MVCQKSCQVCLDTKEILEDYSTVNGDDCIDKNDDCPDLAFKGACVSNPQQMKDDCMLSCGLCFPK